MKLTRLRDTQSADLPAFGGMPFNGPLTELKGALRDLIDGSLTGDAGRPGSGLSATIVGFA